MCTSHQAFREIFEKKGGHPDAAEVSFVVHDYVLQPLLPLTSVRTTAVSASHQFLNVKQKKTRTWTQTKLPFGLKFPARKRKPRAVGRGLPDKRQKSSCNSFRGKPLDASTTDLSEQMEALAEGRPSPEIEQAIASDDEIVLEECDDASLGASNKGSSSSDTGSDSDGLDPGSGSDSEAEKLLLTAQATKEESEVRGIVAQRRTGIEARGEVYCPRGSESAAEQDANPQKDMAPGPSGPSGSTFCNSVLGLVDLGIQVSGRLATCRHCLRKIERQGVRFGYAWSRAKFHSWLHAQCTVGHLNQEGADKVQALAFLGAKLQQEDVLPSVWEASKKIISELRAEGPEP